MQHYKDKKIKEKKKMNANQNKKEQRRKTIFLIKET